MVTGKETFYRLMSFDIARVLSGVQAAILNLHDGELSFCFAANLLKQTSFLQQRCT